MSNKLVTLKYAAVAAAVTAACGGGVAAASTIATAGYQNVSIQGIAAAATTADIKFNDVSLVLANVAYSTSDTVTISISGASFRVNADSSNNPGSINCGKIGSASVGVGLTFLSKTASAVTFKVSSVDNGYTSGTGASCNFAGANLSVVLGTITGSGASSITLSYQANLNGNPSSPYDQSLTPSFHIAGTRNQFTSSSPNTPFSATVDVSAARLAWTSAAKSQTITLSYGSNGADLGALADSAVTVASTLYGAAGTRMFSFLDDAGAGCTNAELTVGPGSAVVSAGSLTITSDCATLSLTNTGVVGSTTVYKPTITLAKATTSTGLAIPDGVFTTQTTYSVAGTTVAQATAAVSAGSFTINGTSIVIPYMPYGTSGTSAITQLFYIMNQSTTAGVVTGSAQNQAGVTCNLGTLGTAAARSVTNLSTAINNAIATCYATAGVFPDGTRVFLEMTANTPKDQTVVNSSYNVGGNSRVNVTNNTNQVRQAQ